MRLPSSEKTGKVSRLPDVILCRPLPSGFMTKSPEPSRVNTIRFALGENAGLVADSLPFVICSMPSPVVWMRKSCAAPTPPGRAEKTIQAVALEAPPAV